MAILIFIALFYALGSVVFHTLRAFGRSHTGTAWWVVFWALLLAGIATGIWAGFYLEYQFSPTVKLIGFPLPVVGFRLESGHWVDYITEGRIRIFISTADAALITLCSVIPVSAAFYVSRYLHRRRLIVTA